MIKMHRRISEAVIVLTMSVLFLTGCTSEASSISSAKNKTEGADVVDTGFTMSTVGSYDSADTAVVLSTDEANKAVTFINMETGKQYTLYYDGTTYVKDKHDGPMTISQIEPGDVVDVTFLKGKKKLASIKLSPDAWVYDDVYNYDLAGANRTASIGSQSYSLPESVVVLSGGRRVDKAEVVSQDVVTISGIEHKIYSINVDKGHGYLSLKNEQPLLGGWIEVGNSTIRQITEDMLLVVPEGTYQVVLNNNGIGCVKDVTIERDKEVVLDVDDIEIPEDATGKILFSVTPENATVSVDGKPVDISKVVELSYGIHRVEASASGYDTLTKHIQVGSEYATISFKLEETRKEDDSVSGNSITRDPWKDSKEPEEDNSVDVIETTKPESVSDNALRSSKNGTVEIHVKDWTTGAELQGVTVQLEVKDSNKKVLSGYPKKKTSPCSFSKSKDSHTYQFTLSMDGYETKTFEPDLEEYQKDETLYFMIKKEESSGTTTNNNTTIKNQGFSEAFISAIVTAVASCDLTNGVEVYIPDPPQNTGILQDDGYNVISKAVENAVQKMVGVEKINDYYYEIDRSLTIVKEFGDSDYCKVEVSVEVGVKNENKKAVIPVEVVIKQKPAEKEISVVISSDIAADEEVKPGDIVTFSVEEVSVDGEKIDDAIIDWTESSENSTGESGEDNTYVLTIGAEETAESITVTATYTDSETGKKGSDEATVKVKKSEEKPKDPETPGEPETPVTPPPTSLGDGEEESDKNPDGTGGGQGENPGGTGGGQGENPGGTGGGQGSENPGGTGGGQGSENPDGTEGGQGENPDGTGGGQGENPGGTGGGQGSENPDGTVGQGENPNGTGGGQSDTGEVTINVTQNAHPIRNFFSSLFK